MKKKRRPTQWDRKVRPANVALSPVERGTICQRIIEAFPQSRMEGGVDRSRYAAIVIFCAERDPPPTTTEVTKGMFSSSATRANRRKNAHKFLLKLRDAKLLKETYEARYVGRYARSEDGKIRKTGMTPGGVVSEATSRWGLKT